MALPLLLAAALMVSAAGSAEASKGIATEVAVGKSAVLTVQSPVARVSLAEPDIADVVVISPTELQINGKKLGETSLVVWDKTGNKTFFEITVVGGALGVLKEKLKEIAPGDELRFQMLNANTLVVTGTVSTDERYRKLHNLLLSYGNDITEEQVSYLQGGTVIKSRASSGGEQGNTLRFVMLVDVISPEQVLLQITVASIDRKATRELGINWAYASDKAVGLFSGVGGITSGISTVTGALALASAGSTQSQTSNGNGPQFGVIDTHNNTAYYIKALAGKGLAKILAEPNLIVKSGQQGQFKAGGEFPYPVIQPGSGVGAQATVTIDFREFGVVMNFKPTVRETGLIQLELVNAEVSSLDFANAVLVGGTRVPALKKDNVKTFVDLREGESFVLAGLINSEWSKNLNKIPLLGDIPILGAFFRDQAMQKTERELVFIVTPKIMKPMAPGQRAELPGAAEPTAKQEDDLRWVPYLPTFRSNDAEQLK